MLPFSIRRLCPSILACCFPALAFGAQSPDMVRPLQLPVDCDPGKTCFVQNYYDHDDGPGARDYQCGTLAYDGHGATDIALANLDRMKADVAVLAAAAGRVEAVRDGMTDVSVSETGAEAIKGREAGNGVLLSHGADWETQYSHLRKGSIRVKPGDHVEAGQVLGLIGLSGNSEFPHLEIEVRHRGRAVDPFVGLSDHDRCGAGDQPLWEPTALARLAYKPTGLVQSGVAPVAPQMSLAREGVYNLARLTVDAPALVFWVEIYGLREGDRETMRLLGPDGAVVADKTMTHPKTKARWLSYTGKKRRGPAWAPGVYRGEYALTRAIEGEWREVLSEVREIRIETP